MTSKEGFSVVAPMSVTILHSAQEGVLLRFGETVDLVDEEDRRCLVEETALLRLLDDVADILDATCDGRQGVEGSLKPVGDDLGQGGLTHTRGSPEDKRRDASCLDHLPQDGPLAHQMLLSDIVVQSARTESFSQWLCHILPAKLL